MKLSNLQQHVIDRMNDGWQLCCGNGIDTHFWIQQGGCGKGGASEGVNLNTFYALYKKRLVEPDKKGFPTSSWKLTGRVG